MAFSSNGCAYLVGAKSSAKGKRRQSGGALSGSHPLRVGLEQATLLGAGTADISPCGFRGPARHLSPCPAQTCPFAGPCRDWRRPSELIRAEFKHVPETEDRQCLVR